MGIEKILVPVDFTPASDAALDYALTMADACGAEVEVLHVWSPNALLPPVEHLIFAETPEGVAMERRLSAAECDHPARVCGRLEFGEEPSQIILSILHRERFDLVVMGTGGHVSSLVSRTAPCKVVALRAA